MVRWPRVQLWRRRAPFRASLRTSVYDALSETAQARGVSRSEAFNQAAWLWAHVVRELGSPGVVRLRVVSEEGDDEEDEPPPGTIHVRRFSGEHVRVLPPPWLGRPDEHPPQFDSSPGIESSRALMEAVYRLAVRVIVAYAVVFVLTVLALLSVVRVLGPR